MPQVPTSSSISYSDSTNVGFLPAGAVTGIGSVPFKNPSTAVDFVEEVSPQIPFWPKPMQGFPCSHMVDQLIQPIKHLLQTGTVPGFAVREGKLDEVLEFMVSGEAGLNHATASGFFAFEDALRAGRFASAAALKGQITGPITLSMNLYHQGSPFIDDPELRGAVSTYISRAALWQVERLKQWGKPVLLFVNEPYLATVKENRSEAASAVLDTVLTAVKSAGALVGVHSCAAPPVFRILSEARPNLVSFDASQDLEKFLRDEDAQGYIRSGGSVAFGFAPLKTSNKNLNVMPHYLRWVMSIPKEISTRELARNSIVTVTCGLSNVDGENARQTFKLARQFGGRLKRLAESQPVTEESA